MTYGETMHIKDSFLKVISFKKWLCFSKTAYQFGAFRKWLFIGTTFAELMNALFILGFSGAFILSILFDDPNILALTSYTEFKNIGINYWCIFFIIGLTQLVSMFVPSIRASKVSGLTLLLSAAIWAFIAGTFKSSGAGFITTAPIIYILWATGVALAGYERVTISKKQERVLHKG